MNDRDLLLIVGLLGITFGYSVSQYRWHKRMSRFMLAMAREMRSIERLPSPVTPRDAGRIAMAATVAEFIAQYIGGPRP